MQCPFHSVAFLDEHDLTGTPEQDTIHAAIAAAIYTARKIGSVQVQNGGAAVGSLISGSEGWTQGGPPMRPVVLAVLAVYLIVSSVY